MFVLTDDIGDAVVCTSANFSGRPSIGGYAASCNYVLGVICDSAYSTENFRKHRL